MTDVVQDPPEIDDGTLEDDRPTDEAWQIKDDSDATFGGDRLRHYKGRAAQHHVFAETLRNDLRARYQAKLKLIDDWEESAVSRETPHIEKWTGRLLNYFRQLREADPTLKTKYLPGITLLRRPASKGLSVTDDGALLSWLLALPEDDPQRLALKPPKILKSNLLFNRTTDDGALVTKDGELIPGVVQVVGEEKFDVKLEADEDVE